MKLAFLFAALSLGAPEKIANIIYQEATWAGVDPVLVLAIAHTETGGTYYPRAYNDTTRVRGLMQVAPFWADHFNIPRSKMFRIKQSVRLGSLVLNYLEDNFNRMCNNHHNRWLCENRITPLHMYRCKPASANMRGCWNSVGAVRSIQRQLYTEIERIIDAKKEEEFGVANSCRPVEVYSEAQCSSWEIPLHKKRVQRLCQTTR